jgi:hypothetical protein
MPRLAPACASPSRQGARRIDINKIAKVQVRAIRKGGRLLIEMAQSGERPAHGGDRNPLIPNLSQLGFTKGRSTRWQFNAKYPDDKFAELRGANNRSGKSLLQPPRDPVSWKDKEPTMTKQVRASRARPSSGF